MFWCVAWGEFGVGTMVYADIIASRFVKTRHDKITRASVHEARLALNKGLDMKIILLSDVYKHGVAGEIVEVADGFARNYLIPKGLATKATQSSLKRYEKMRASAETRRMEYENMLNELGRKIDGTHLVFSRRAANTGKLFGSVTTADIALALHEATDVDINRRRISQQGIRELGLHEVAVRLGTDVSPVLNIRVIDEGQQIEYNRQMEAISEGLLDAIEYTETGHIRPVNVDKLRSNKAKAEAEVQAAEDAEMAAAIAAVEAAEAEAAAESAETDATEE